MANNTGLIFGTVTDFGGKPIEGVDITLSWILGEGQVRVGGSENLGTYVKRAVTDDKGRYVLPFYWEAADIGKLGQGFGTASVLAMNWGARNAYTSLNQRGQVYLMLDLRKLIAVGYPALPASGPELASILKDFVGSYRGMLPSHGVFYPTPVLSTEMYGLCGRIRFQMARP